MFQTKPSHKLKEIELIKIVEVILRGSVRVAMRANLFENLIGGLSNSRDENIIQ